MFMYTRHSRLLPLTESECYPVVSWLLAGRHLLALQHKRV